METLLALKMRTFLFTIFNYFSAMDTEFPGVVARPIGEFKSTSDYQYQVKYVQHQRVHVHDINDNF